MIGTTTLTIIQYNVNKSKDKVQRSFLQSLDPRVHHIIAVQEPWLNPHTSKPATCKDPRFHTIMSKQGNPRACLYISKDVTVADWQQITQEGDPGDLATVKSTTDQGTIQVHSNYNPPPDS